jgi:hypothetical protein
MPLIWLFGLLTATTVASPEGQILAPLPVQDGEIAIDGLKDRVEILRDEWGIPHIYAATATTCFRTGSQAQDRRQMEWWRHLGNGRLSELADADCGRTFSSARWEVSSSSADNENYDGGSRLPASFHRRRQCLSCREPGDLAVEYTGPDRRNDISVEPDAARHADLGQVHGLQPGGQYGH